MVFCPETGDPAKVKPKLYLTESRFDLADGQAFMLTPAADGVAVDAKPAWESELPRLTEMLNDPARGLPVPITRPQLRPNDPAGPPTPGRALSRPLGSQRHERCEPEERADAGPHE